MEDAKKKMLVEKSARGAESGRERREQEEGLKKLRKERTKKQLKNASQPHAPLPHYRRKVSEFIKRKANLDQISPCVRTAREVRMFLSRKLLWRGARGRREGRAKGEGARERKQKKRRGSAYPV